MFLVLFSNTKYFKLIFVIDVQFKIRYIKKQGVALSTNIHLLSVLNIILEHKEELEHSDVGSEYQA